MVCQISHRTSRFLVSTVDARPEVRVKGRVKIGARPWLDGAMALPLSHPTIPYPTAKPKPKPEPELKPSRRPLRAWPR